MYKSGIDLNLNSSATAVDLNNSELSITELYAINAITKQQQEQDENAFPTYTLRPTVQKEKFDDSKFYHFVLTDIETNSTGKSAELCQLAAVDRSNKQFSCYILSNRDERLFQTTFDAHDALGDVTALRRILFSSRLALSDEMLVNRSSVVPVKDAAEDLKYLDNRHDSCPFEESCTTQVVWIAQ